MSIASMQFVNPHSLMLGQSEAAPCAAHHFDVVGRCNTSSGEGHPFAFWMLGFRHPSTLNYSPPTLPLTQLFPAHAQTGGLGGATSRLQHCHSIYRHGLNVSKEVSPSIQAALFGICTRLFLSNVCGCWMERRRQSGQSQLVCTPVRSWKPSAASMRNTSCSSPSSCRDSATK